MIFVRALALLLALSGSALAQSGQIPSGTVWGNSGASKAIASPATFTAMFDRALGSTTGAVIARSAATWGLVSGTTTQLLHGNAGGVPTFGALVAADVTANTLTNATLAQAAASTLKGNATASTANVTDFTITGLTSKATPAGADEVLLSDSAASNAFKKASVTSLSGTILAGAVTTYNTRAGAVTATGTDVPLRSYLAGLTLSTAGASTTFGIAAGAATDSTNVSMMALASAYTKTTSAWALGTAAGSLDGGAIANLTWYHTYLIKRTDTGVVDVLTSEAPGTNSAITVTIAAPGVVTWANHGLQAGTPIVFTTTGALPTGITAGTVYYVCSGASLTLTSFTLATSYANALVPTQITTSGSQSGVHTGTSNPVLPTNYTLFRRIGSMRTNGSAQWTKFYQLGDLFTWDAPIADFSAYALGTTNTLFTLSVPVGFGVEVNFSAFFGTSGGVGAYMTFYSSLITATAANIPAGNISLYNATASGSSAGQFTFAADSWGRVGGVAGGVYTSPVLYIVTLGWRDHRGRDD